MSGAARTVLVVGATGYVGSAVAEHLAAQGHRVVALSRTALAHDGLRRMGVTCVEGDLTDGPVIERAAADCEAAIYAAGPRSPDAERIETAALDSLARSLPSGAPLIYTSGCSVYGQASPAPAVETDPVADNAKTRAERRVLSAERLAPMIVRPGLVHGRGGGIIGRLGAHGRADGTVPVPEGDWMWSVVHVDDLGRLYSLMLKDPERGLILNAAEESPVSIRKIAVEASVQAGPNVPVHTFSLAEAAARIGPVAHLLARHAAVRSDRARGLGWTPKQTLVPR